MKKWVKVDASGKIVEIVDSDKEPAKVTGHTFRESTGNEKVGDKVNLAQGSTSGSSAYNQANPKTGE